MVKSILINEILCIHFTIFIINIQVEEELKVLSPASAGLFYYGLKVNSREGQENNERYASYLQYSRKGEAGHSYKAFRVGDGC